MLKISASSRFHTEHPDGYFSPIEMLDHFHRCGFESVDFDLETVPDYMGDDRQVQLAAIVERANKLNISLEIGHLPFHKTRRGVKITNKEFLEGMYMSLEAAAFVGIRYAVIHPKNKIAAKHEIDFEGYMRESIEYFTPIAEFAQKHGVVLAFENMPSYKEAEEIHRYCSTAEEIAVLADYFNMGTCWDFGHANITGVDQRKSLNYLGGRIVAIHVDDNHGTIDEHLLPYFGTVNWTEAIKGLKESGYSGPFNFECKVLNTPASVREELGIYAVALSKALQSL